MNAPHTPHNSFAELSYDETMARARALVPTLRERAAAAETARVLAPETIDDLNRTGLLRYAQPKRWGGAELDFVAIFDVPAEIGRGCGSTAWSVANLGIHHWMLALYEEQAQSDIWGPDPDALIASGVAFNQGKARQVHGGYLIEGYWNFSSCVNIATWNMLAVIVYDDGKPVDQRICLVPKDQYEIVDDWQVMGMRSTGSMSVRAKDVFVPEHRALCTYVGKPALNRPGLETNTAACYRVPFGPFGAHAIGGAAVGNAQGALEMTIELVKARSTNYTGARMRDFQAVQLRISEAAAKIDAARLILRTDCIEGQRRTEAAHEWTLEESLRPKRNLAFAARLCTEAVDSLHMLAGANGIYDKYPIQRMFRDAHSLGAHYLFSWDAQAGPWALVQLGGEYKLGTL